MHEVLHRLDLCEEIACALLHSLSQVLVGGVVVVQRDEGFKLRTEFQCHSHHLLLEE